MVDGTNNVRSKCALWHCNSLAHEGGGFEASLSLFFKVRHELGASGCGVPLEKRSQIRLVNSGKFPSPHVNNLDLR